MNQRLEAVSDNQTSTTAFINSLVAISATAALGELK